MVARPSEILGGPDQRDDFNVVKSVRDSLELLAAFVKDTTKTLLGRPRPDNFPVK